MTIPIMQIADIEREIRTFLVSTFLFGKGDALRDDELLLGNVIDSSGTIELLMFLQEQFGITVEDEEIAVPENFASVRNIAAYISKKLGKSQTG